MVKNISARDLKALIIEKRDTLELIDVREKSEYDIIHLKNSKLIPMNELEDRVNEIDWTKEVVFICRSGSRSGIMANFLSTPERTITNLDGGIYGCYRDKEYPELEISQATIGMYF